MIKSKKMCTWPVLVCLTIIVLHVPVVSVVGQNVDKCVCSEREGTGGGLGRGDLYQEGPWFG